MDSTDSSFVMVDHNTPPPAQDQLQSFSRYFPSLSKSSNFVYSRPALIEQIHEHRSKAPDGRLFFDELVSLAGLNGPAVYPPKSPNDLQSIILQVLSSTKLSSINISAILYYLALSCSPSTAAEFAQSRLLPPEFSLSIRAFHSLDTEEYDLAIRLLSDPRIRQPDFVSKTIRLLANAPGSKPGNRHKLVLAYWRLIGLEFRKQEGKFEVEEAELILRALCDPKRKRGVGEAWELARTWGEEKEIERLMKAMLAACFGDNHTRLLTAQHLQSLLSYPFTVAELSLLTGFCVSPPSSLPSTAHSLAADWFLSLLISASKPLQALVFYHKLRTNGKLEPSEERERLLKALEATLTISQKTTLSIEIASLSSSSSTSASAPASTTSQTPAQPPATTSSSITQPAWVPPASVSAPTPSTPVRTLAAARQSKLPPPAAPTPKSSDLPLSASPFVRKDGGAGQGVLKALREQQGQGGNTRLGMPTPASPAASSMRFGGTPVRSGVLPSLSGRSAVGAGSQYTESVVGGNEEMNATPVKPTLAGFGSIRQQSQQFQSPAMQEIEMDTESRQEEEEEEEEDQVMLVPSPQNQVQPPLPAPSASTSTPARKEDDFFRRIALDPAIQKTLLAASTSSKKPPTPSNEEGPTTKTPKRTRGGARDSKQSQQDRGDMKRRAVSSEPEGKGKEATSSSKGGAEKEQEREKPDQDKTVKLPPGAFPGMEEDQPESTSTSSRTRRGSRAGSSQPEMRERTQSTSRRSTTAAARRSTRSRSTSVAPEGEEEEESSGRPQPTPRRKSSRASSLQPPEMSEVSKSTPVRRSSRLSSSSTTNAAASSTRRTTRRGQKAIEEEEEGENEDDD
ncbi:uncharacterized protein JCM6883_006503 [Sporobolomyces salmoneus]|uniref:uncharacterized protein n=1 Tax=Sporobolomyces salmoneus TaxID=183962 RepID=UPI0031773D2C